MLLRYSNAERRLIGHSVKHNLLTYNEIRGLQNKIIFTDEAIGATLASFAPDIINSVLNRKKEVPVNQKTPLKEILKRPNISINDFRKLHKTKYIYTSIYVYHFIWMG